MDIDNGKEGIAGVYIIGYYAPANLTPSYISAKLNETFIAGTDNVSVTSVYSLSSQFPELLTE